MAKTITLEIVTPDKMVLKEEVDYVGAPGINGEFGVLPNHIPFLSALGIGSLYYKLNGKKYFVFVAGGFAEVSPAKVTVLAEVAEKAEDIDLERARRAQDRAEQRARQQQEKLDHAAVQAALARALHRMKCRANAVSEGTCRM